MLIRTSIALAAAFLGFASVAEANNEDTQFRQVEGFSFHVGPLGQYFGSRAPREFGEPAPATRPGIARTLTQK